MAIVSERNGRILKKTKYTLEENLNLKTMDSEETDVKELLEELGLSLSELTYAIENDVKKRYSFNSDKTKIRKNQNSTKNKVFNSVKKKPPDTSLARKYK